MEIKNKNPYVSHSVVFKIDGILNTLRVNNLNEDGTYNVDLIYNKTGDITNFNVKEQQLKDFFEQINNNKETYQPIYKIEKLYKEQKQKENYSIKNIFFSILHLIITVILVIIVDIIIIWVFNVALFPLFNWINGFNIGMVIISFIFFGVTLLAILNLIAGIPIGFLGKVVFYHFPKNSFTVYSSLIIIIINSIFLIYGLWDTPEHYYILTIIESIGLSIWVIFLMRALFVGINYFKEKK